jgi:ribonuclease P protein component
VSASSAGRALPVGERLRRSADFQAVFQQGSRLERASVVALWRRAERRRVGFAVSRQLRGAVQRNRARRRIREAYRQVRGLFPGDVELVVVGRAGAATRPFPELVEDMRRLAEGLVRASRATEGRE